MTLRPGDDSAQWSESRRVPGSPAAGPPSPAPPAAARFSPPSSGRAASDSPADGGFGPATLHGNPGSVRRQPASTPLPADLDPGRGRRTTAPPVRTSSPPAVATNSTVAMPPPSAAGAVDPIAARTDRVAARAATVPPATGSRSARYQRERGLPGWQALVVLLVICAIGGLIDVMNGSNVRGGFNVAIVVASFVGILIVRRSAMFTIVVAPPLVYAIASAVKLAGSGGLTNRNAVIDEASNWLIYGFPAIAGATAAVLLVAGIRLILGR